MEYLHKIVKLHFRREAATSNFEEKGADTVNTKVVIGVDMKSDNTLTNIDQEHGLDRETAEQLAKIVQFLRNIED